jgi:hypothetical protein
LAKEFSKAVISLCRDIHELRMKVGEEWEPEIGHWLVICQDNNPLLRPFLRLFVGMSYEGYYMLINKRGRPSHIETLEAAHPILCWQQCREWLWKEGWILQHLGETQKSGGIGIRVVKSWDIQDTEEIDIKAPTDHEAILLVVKKVLEREAKND